MNRFPRKLLALLCVALASVHAAPMVTTGGTHSVVLRADGTARAWGSDREGQSGAGTSIFFPTFELIRGLPPLDSGFDSLAASGVHALAIAADGSVRAMGANYSGQLGDNTRTDRSAPVTVLGLGEVVSIAASSGNGAAVTRDGSVWTWGENSQGQLGNGRLGYGLNDLRLRPERVAGLSGFVAVASAGYTLALRGDGTVWAWGNNARGQLGDGTTTTRLSPVQVPGLAGIVQVAAGPEHALARGSDGSVWAWGGNGSGQLCDGTTADRPVPRRIAGIVAARVSAGGTGWLTSARAASYFISPDGRLSLCGSHGSAQLFLSPAIVDGLTQVVNVRGDTDLGIAIRADGTAWAFGTSSHALVRGPGPRVLPGLAGATAAALGQGFVLIATSRGTYGWGRDDFGVLGSGRPIARSTPVAVRDLDGIVQVAGGTGGSNGGHTLALRSDGSVWSWGGGYHGQLGNGSYVSSGTPVRVVGLDNILHVAAGGAHSVAVRNDGTVWTWGDNHWAQLGMSIQPDSTPVPRQVPGVSGAVRVAARDLHTFVVRADGSVLAWGENGNGQLGFVSTEQCIEPPVPCTRTPTLVPGATGVVDIAGSNAHTLALRSDGTLLAWGYNASGNLGDGTTASRMTPAPVPGLAGVALIAAGGGGGPDGFGPFSVAVKRDGTLWSWGSNGRGQLGDGTLEDRHRPGIISGVEQVTSVAAGFQHTVTVKRDGTVWAWGGNFVGQLGDGTFVDRSKPVVVMREEGAGSLDGNDWFLRLDPAGTATIPASAVPNLLVISRGLRSVEALVLDATAKQKSAEAGRKVNLHVLAVVPPAFFDQVKLAPGSESAKELRAKGKSLVFAQLTPQGWTSAQGQLIAYSQSVASVAGAAASILNGINAASIPGARFCIGYGESSDAMLSALTLREVLEIPGSTASVAGAPCLLTGVYVGGPPASRLFTPVTFTASVVGLSPGGTVQFQDGGSALLGPVVLTAANPAVATGAITTSALAAGVHGISAAYSGDAQNAPVSAANGVALRHEVSAPPGGTRVDLGGPAASALATPVAFSAIVTGDRPTGTVQFRDGTVDLGAPVALVGGMAVLNLSTLGLGIHALSAAYSGDAANAASNSNMLTHTVRATTTTRIALASSSNPSRYGAAVAVTATVTGTNPTGSVVFRDGSATVATVTLTNGIAVATLVGLERGLHIVTAEYPGDGANAAVSSAALFQQVEVGAPPPFVFAARSGVPTSLVVTSNAVTITGIGSAAPISVTAGEYSIGCGATFTTAAATIADGQSVCVRHTSSAAHSTITRTVLVIGTMAADFVSTTLAESVRAGISALVSHYFAASLRRPADAPGQAYWEAEALRLMGLGADVNEAFYAMAMSFFASAEYTNLARDSQGFVIDLYATFFNRAPDAGGMAHWSGQLSAGLPREVLLAQFMFSPEFSNRMRGLFGDRAARAEVDVVVDFYRGMLSRLPDTAGFEHWVQRFRAAQCAGAANVFAEVESISGAFAGSAEYSGRNRDTTRYVADLYNAFLRRGGDLEGVRYWIGQVETGARTREQLRREFMASPEFSARVNAIVAQGCL